MHSAFCSLPFREMCFCLLLVLVCLDVALHEEHVSQELRGLDLQDLVVVRSAPLEDFAAWDSNEDLLEVLRG